MSSTNRGKVRQEHDYYATKPRYVARFLRWLTEHDHAAHHLLRHGDILDPCAGGCTELVEWEYKQAKAGKSAQVMLVPPHGMSYPEAIAQVFPHRTGRVITNDIRPNSPAEHHEDFILSSHMLPRANVVITNPPFARAMEIITTSFWRVTGNGLVIMLLRLNWLGSRERNQFMQDTPPALIVVEPERMGFTPDGGADSIEYAHFMWRVVDGKPVKMGTSLVVLPVGL